jgi:hypothetical protein
MSADTATAQPEPALVPIRTAHERLGLSRSALEKRLTRRGLEVVRVVERGIVRCFVRELDLAAVSAALPPPARASTASTAYAAETSRGEAARALPRRLAAAECAAERWKVEADALRVELAQVKGELRAAEVIERNNARWLEREEARHAATKEALDAASKRVAALEATLEVFRELDRSHRASEAKAARSSFLSRFLPMRRD